MAPWYLTDISLWVATTIIGIIGLVLAVRGLIGDRARGRPTCFKCRYDMSTLESLACPECGHIHAHRKQLFKTRRYYRRFILGTILLLLALHCHTGPEVQYRREQLGEKWWESVVPTTVWIVMLPYLEDERVEFLEKRTWRSEPPNPNGLVSTHLFIDSGEDEEPLDQLFVASPPIWSGTLSDWQCRLLANAVHRRLDRIPYTPPAPTLTLPPGLQPRKIAANWIIHMRAQVDVLDDLIALSADGDPVVRREALLALGDETRIEKVLPVLLAALDDSDTQVRLAATQVLGQLGPKARAAVPVLLAAISHPSNNTKVDVSMHTITFWINQIDLEEPLRAIMLLALLRIDTAKGMPIIIDSTEISAAVYQTALGIAVKSDVAPTTLWALAIRLGLAHDEAFQQFITIDIDPTKPIHERAARSLMSALASDSRDKRTTARRVIEQMGVAQLSLMHWAALQDDIDINEEFIGLMITLGDKANSLTHVVARKMLRDPARYRGQIMDMLAHTGPPSKEVIAVLREAMNHEDEAVREMATFTLEQIQR